MLNSLSTCSQTSLGTLRHSSLGTWLVTLVHTSLVTGLHSCRLTSCVGAFMEERNETSVAKKRRQRNFQGPKITAKFRYATDLADVGGDGAALALGLLHLHVAALGARHQRALLLHHLLRHLAPQVPRHVLALLPRDVTTHLANIFLGRST